MKCFDSHVHFFPEFLANKALTRLADVCGCPYYSEGTKDDTQKKLQEWNCAGGLLLSIATNEKQQTSVNDFAAASQADALYAFGSVFPGAANMKEELRRIKSLGLRGVKLHPDYQEFFVLEDRAMEIYEEAEKLGLPIAFHAGRDPYSPNAVHCTPEALGKIAELFPRLTIIAAHMGGLAMPQEAAKHLAGKKNVYFDTAFASHFLTLSQFEELTRLHGTDRVLFATDCPWSTVPLERELLEACSLSASQKEAIACENVQALLQIRI